MNQKTFHRSNSNWRTSTIADANMKDIGAQKSQKPLPWAPHEIEYFNEQEINQLAKTSNHKVVHPWDMEEADIISDFERDLRVVSENNGMYLPWEGTPDDVHEQQQSQRLQAKNYKFESLFEPSPLTDKKIQQLAEYKYNPPFQTKFNAVINTKKREKKIFKEYHGATRHPSTYGTLPAESNQLKRNFELPPTEIWTVPKPDQSVQPLDNFQSSGDPVLDSLRMQLLKHGASGIHGLARKFRIMDDDNNGTLNFEEFRKGLKECELIYLQEKAIKHLFHYFDTDDSGSITFDEFLFAIRGSLNERRRELVHMAFNIMDRDKSGQIDFNDIIGIYNAKNHPDVKRNLRSEEEVLKEFLQTFESGSKEKDGIVTLQEFENYYANLSASIDNDDYFELMIRNSWHISGGRGSYENTTNRRVLVTHADGRQSVEEVKNDIGISSKDQNSIAMRLKAQGIDVKTMNFNGAIGEKMNNQVEVKPLVSRLNDSTIRRDSKTLKPQSLSGMLKSAGVSLR